MRYDVVAIGEPIIDFVELPPSPRGNLVYEAYTGGGACNVLAQVSAYGGRAAVIGAVGKDLFGEFVSRKLNEAGVETPNLHRTGVKHTGIGFVHLREDGERTFTFYRNPEKKVELFRNGDEETLRQTALFHFTSITMTGPTIRESTLAAVAAARRNGVGVSFDINHRPSIWGDRAGEADGVIRDALTLADIVKISEEEKAHFFGDISDQACAGRLHELGAKLVAISKGSAGSFYSYAGGQGVAPGIVVKAVDATGCGDAFAGTLLAQIAGLGGVAGLAGAAPAAMRRMFATANVAGALCASRYGSFTVMPKRLEIEAAMEGVRE